MDAIKLGLAVLGAVWLTLAIGGGVIWLLEKAKQKARGSGRELAMLQIIVLVCTVLTIGWKTYWVMYPSTDEVQWQRETNEYGLY